MEYREELRKNYLVIEPRLQEESFEDHMLRELNSEGVLRCELRYEDKVKKLYCDVSNLSPLTELSGEKQLGVEDISLILIRIKSILDMLSGYMIAESSVCIEPELIYTAEDSLSLKLCVVPGENRDTKKGIRALIDFMLIHGRRDPGTLSLLAELFEISRRESFDIDKLIAACERERKGRKEEEDTQEEKAGVFEAEAGKDLKIAENPLPEGSPYEPSYEEQKLPLGETEIPEREETYKGSGYGVTGRLAVTLGAILLPPVLIFLLRGEHALIRFIPVLAVVDIALIIFNIVSMAEAYREEKRGKAKPDAEPI